MALTDEQYAALVQRLERGARKHPAIFRCRVGGLALLGFAYVPLIIALHAIVFLFFLVILISTRILGGRIMVATGRTLGVLCRAAIRALRVTFGQPNGRPLTRQEASALYALVDELGAALCAPRCHQIYVTDEFSAFATQYPRLGWLGWQQNYVTIGLPMLQALSYEDMRAVLIHEMAHISGQHGRSGGWLHRLRQMWGSFSEQVGEHEEARGAMQGFLDWFAPRFGAHVFALRRLQEIEADRRIVDMVGPQGAARALLASSVYGRYVREIYWPAIYRRVDEDPAPLRTPLARLGETLHAGLAADVLAPLLQAALQRETNLSDEHLGLADRLAECGCAITRQGDTCHLPHGMEVPACPRESAAERLLGPALPGITADLDEGWRLRVMARWCDRYDQVQQARQTLRELEERDADTPQSEDERWARITAMLTSGEDQDAVLPLLHELLERNPDHAAANFALGEILLARDDMAGVSHLRKLMDGDPFQGLEACHVIYEYLMRKGLTSDAEQYLIWAQHTNGMLEEAQKERNIISCEDDFYSHVLPDDTLVHLRRTLAQYPEVLEVYVVGKTVRLLPEQPCHVLAVRFALGVRGLWGGRKRIENLLAVLSEEISLPTEHSLIVLTRTYSKLRRALAQVPGSLVYRRGMAPARKEVV